jgi:hypothetical protein
LKEQLHSLTGIPIADQVLILCDLSDPERNSDRLLQGIIVVNRNKFKPLIAADFCILPFLLFIRLDISIACSLMLMLLLLLLLFVTKGLDDCNLRECKISAGSFLTLHALGLNAEAKQKLLKQAKAGADEENAKLGGTIYTLDTPITAAQANHRCPAPPSPDQLL